MDIALVILAYLIGSIPSAYIATRLLAGKDIRTVGSGNVGGMNTARNVGAAAGVATALADVAKGLAAVRLAQVYGGQPWVSFAAAVAAVAGHNWMLFLGFKGGKGLAVSLAAVALLFPVAIPVAAGTLVIVAFALKDTYMGVVAAYVALPVAMLVMSGGRADLALFGAAIAAVVVAKHVENIKDFVAGRKRLV